MNRRNVIRTALIFSAGASLLPSCLQKDTTDLSLTNIAITGSEEKMMAALGEAIIPTTNFIGATGVQASQFTLMMVNDCYPPDEQKIFTVGMAGLNDACKKVNDKNFMDCSPEQRKSFLITLEKEAKEYNTKRDEKEKTAKENAKMNPDYIGMPSHYYTMMKQLTLLGYFSSEIGSKQALRFLPIPGKYDGAYPYKKGDKAWAI